MSQELQESQQAPIDFLAFSGGGAKGAIYSGVYSALKSSGTMDGIKCVAGSSAGAITAALVSTGMEPDKFEELCRTTNLKGLLGKKGFIINKDGLPLYELLQDTIRDNISQYILQENIQTVAQKRLQEIEKEPIEILKKQEALTKKDGLLETDINEIKRQIHLMDAPSSIRALDARLQLLKLEKEKLSAAMKGLEYDKKQSQKQAVIINQIANGNDKEFEDLRKRCTEKGPIYFKDIAILNAFDPIRFKNLAVTAVKKHNGEPYTFSAAHTPNVEIALACRASASIPGVFAPVKIQIPEIVKDQHGLDINTESRYEFVDGGYRDNIPGNLKYFQSQDLGIENITGQNEKIKSSIKAGRVLAFAFGSTKVDHPVQIALYSGKRKIYEPGFIEEYLSNILYKSAVGVGGNFKYTQTVENTFQELRHNALNIVPLDTKDVGTLSFAQATKKGEYLHIKGYMQTMRHMKNHELTAKHDKFLDQKDFLLTIYEKVESPTIIQSWVRKISSGYSDKAKKLLSFCKSEAFTDKSETEVLKEYIKLAATNRRTSKMDINTNTMKKLIETLNDPLTSVQIKTDFIGLLKGNKFFADPKLDISNYKFKKDDFKKFLSPEKEAALNKSPSRSR